MDNTIHSESGAFDGTAHNSSIFLLLCTLRTLTSILRCTTICIGWDCNFQTYLDRFLCKLRFGASERRRKSRRQRTMNRHSKHSDQTSNYVFIYFDAIHRSRISWLALYVHRCTKGMENCGAERKSVNENKVWWLSRLLAMQDKLRPWAFATVWQCGIH